MVTYIAEFMTARFGNYKLGVAAPPVEAEVPV